MTESGTRSPSLAQQHSVIQLHSPLAVAGMFIYLLREYFGAAQLPWVWDKNDTQSTLIIESTYNPQTENADGKPALYIEKGQTAYGQVVLGDKDQSQPGILERRLEHFYAILQTDVIINCTSPRKGESATIADYVQHFITCSKNEISRVFAVYDFSPLVAGSTQPYNKDEKCYNTPVSFRVEMETRWATIPVAAALRRIEASFTSVGLTVNEGFVQVFQHTTGKDNTT